MKNVNLVRLAEPLNEPAHPSFPAHPTKRGRGLPHSKTLRVSEDHAPNSARVWTAPGLWRFPKPKPIAHCLAFGLALLAFASAVLGQAQPNPAGAASATLAPAGPSTENAAPLPAALARGILEEEGNLNPRAAVRNYQAVVAQFDEQRRFVATALFRLGECYRKLGQTNEAVVQFQRVLREFADQPALATLARQNLQTLGVSLTTGATRAGSEFASAEVSLLAAQLSGLDQLKDHPEERARAVMALFPDDDLKQMLLNLPRLREQEAQFQADPRMKLDMARQGFRVAVGPGGHALRSGTGGFGGSKSPGLSEAQEEVKSQLIQIERRVDFIVGLQKAKLLALQAGAKPYAAVEVIQNAGATAGAPSEQDEELRRIQEIQKNSPDLINAVGKNNETLLEAACGKGQLEVVKYLLDHGASVNGTTQPGLTPLHYAAGNGQLAVLKLLLERGAKPNVATESDVTPLHLAVLKGYEQVAKALLDAGASVNVEVARNASPDLPDLQYSLTAGVRPLELALASGNAALASLLLDHGADVNARASSSTGYTMLETAASRGETPLIDLLLRHGADINATGPNGMTPLHLAAENGQVDALKALIAAKADLNARAVDGQTPLIVAARTDKRQAAEILLKAGADPNISTRHSITPLAEAVSLQDETLARQLLESGASPNTTAPRAESETVNRTNDSILGLVRPIDTVVPLETSCYDDNLPITKLLLDHGANPNIRRTSDGLPLLAFDSVLDDPELLKLLLAHKADPNLTNKQGETPLHVAPRTGNTNAVALLVAHGANVNARAENGATPLHTAVSARRLDMVEALIAAHADLNATDQAGRTPLDIAKALPAQPQPAPYLMAAHVQYGLIPSNPGMGGYGQTQRPGPQIHLVASAAEIIDALRRAGALEEIPHPDRIEAGRRSCHDTQAVFQKGTNDWNRFTLLELIADRYGLISTSEAWRRGDRFGGLNFFTHDYRFKSAQNGYCLQYPDFARLAIRHISSDGQQWTERRIDLSAAFENRDCASDVPLQWGDVVDIPEADHPLNEPWPGPSTNVLATLKKCLTRHLEVVVKGQTNQLVLAPDIIFGPDGSVDSMGSDVPFMLRPALLRSNLILASSDLSRVKVTRTDLATGEHREWVLDCSDSKTAPGLWLRDGDRVDVPEKD
jgi:ankyrin repeat protein